MADLNKPRVSSWLEKLDDLRIVRFFPLCFLSLMLPALKIGARASSTLVLGSV